MKTMYAYFALTTLLALILPIVSNAEDTVTHLRTKKIEINLKSTMAPGGKKGAKGTKAPRTKRVKAPKVKKVKVTKANTAKRR